MTEFQRARRAAQPFVWLLSAALLVAGPVAIQAHSPDQDSGEQGRQGQEFSSAVDAARSEAGGKGMPSVEGPFPDTYSMNFLGQLTNEELGVDRLIRTGAPFLSDIWGWTDTAPDPDEEYAIIGTTSGVAFVRITDPTAPEFLGMIPTTNTNTRLNWWWDIKTFGNYAYFVTEVADAGIGILDLTQLAGRSSATSDLPFNFVRVAPDGYRAAHNISINENTGFAYLTGVTDDNRLQNAVLILDLNGDPMAPTPAGDIQGIDSHDAQIVTYAGPDLDLSNDPRAGQEIAFVFNGTDLQVGIYDVTDKGNIQHISSTSYAGASFTHQGWLTEDHGFLLAGDEEDEYFGVMDPRNPDLPDTARTYVWDVRDLDDPQVIGSFDSEAASIDHNLFVKDGLVYQANYTAGIRVLDASDVANGNLSEVAHMDTEPRLPNNHMNLNFNIFAGPWGVYPFFDSGTIIASDGFNGLILMSLDLPLP